MDWNKQNGREMKRFLIIEDNKMMAMILAQLLRQSIQSPQILHAPTLQQTYQYLSQYTVDVVFLDLNIERPLDGIDLLMHIREIHPTLPVVIVTSDSEIDTVKRVVALNPTDYLIKPLSLNNLQACLEKCAMLQ
ncbi:hypothetical transcriptional regulator [Photobacterium aphoticum]|uniref:Hypothetical transcriptional regulator n=1 Tax=Photobacterium aphoticum TaxID=754436 RepID=A0A090QMX3_9GAMM|nr:hypothetical transcriptional regulator [Photobacterium aphoticum]